MLYTPSVIRKNPSASTIGVTGIPITPGSADHAIVEAGLLLTLHIAAIGFPSMTVNDPCLWFPLMTGRAKQRGKQSDHTKTFFGTGFRSRVN